MYACTGSSRKKAKQKSEEAMLEDGQPIRWTLRWQIEELENGNSHPIYCAIPIGKHYLSTDIQCFF